MLYIFTRNIFTGPNSHLRVYGKRAAALPHEEVVPLEAGCTRGRVGLTDVPGPQRVVGAPARLHVHEVTCENVITKYTKLPVRM